jgi:Ca2+-binding EF-hand superfamily protein
VEFWISEMDTDQSGTISLQQFVDGMERWRKAELNGGKGTTETKRKR